MVSSSKFILKHNTWIHVGEITHQILNDLDKRSRMNINQTSPEAFALVASAFPAALCRIMGDPSLTLNRRLLQARLACIVEQLAHMDPLTFFGDVQDLVRDAGVDMDADLSNLLHDGCPEVREMSVGLALAIVERVWPAGARDLQTGVEG